MSSRLYVGNLSYSTTVESLRAFFETVGEVRKAEIITDRETNRSKGFGFVEMSTPEAAQQAMERLNGKLLDNRPVRIDLARPKEARPPQDRPSTAQPRTSASAPARATPSARAVPQPPPRSPRPSQSRQYERKRRASRKRIREEETPRWLQNKRLLLTELDEEL
ncbi:MAG: RNA-binding protein [Thermoflexales bacterium]|nr:RNA-binding protein [Thermoflexales bacterium]MCS7324247.1 RNA-binding protein [Thermoflexales bacterium]MCX7939112.1 RNA-binding protein [Thermoflexales bacterium]MDW8054472.1 RNA-binding protein [Anaerolineae bacterium]